MIYLRKKYNYKRVLFSIGLIFICFNFSFGQNLTGLLQVQQNTQETYEFDDGFLYTNFNWIINGGSILTSGLHPKSTKYFVQVQWGVSGLGSVIARDKSDDIETLNVDIFLFSDGNSLNSFTSNENYIHTLMPRLETSDVAQLYNNERIEAITYFDGLGRVKQTNSIRAGGNEEDIIKYIDYDIYGRMVEDYLPYALNNNNGAYKSNALNSTDTFYNTVKYENTLNPFFEKEFEKSPLSRVYKQAAPGFDWRMGGGHEIEFEYDTNVVNEVKFYEVSLTIQNSNDVITYLPTLNLNGSYGVGELYKTITKDENHDGTSSKAHTTEEFQNKRGQVVLKRTYGTSIVNGVSQTNVSHDTYYAYDDYGNLTYVLPPKSEPHTTVPSATVLNELCYQYKYDNRNRLVERKIPGKGWEYIVYNKLNQPVMTQDTKLKTQGKWLFTKYDAFGRVVYTGVQNSVESREYNQGLVNIHTTQYETKTPTSGLFNTYYTSNSIPVYFDEVYTINYYDNYTFNKVNGNSENSYGITPISNIKGLSSGSKVKVLGTNDWITHVNYYDQKGRSIYSYSFNDYLNVTDKTKNNIVFDGRVVESTNEHIRTGFSTITTVDTFEYDNFNRLLTQKQSINGANDQEVIVENSFDELGQLESKGVGGKTTQSRLQNIDFAYNVRGWLKKINNPALLGDDLFGFELNYNDVNYNSNWQSEQELLYNGNISKTAWKSSNDNKWREYNPKYDALNRLSGADYRAQAEGYRYTVDNITYDKNGNILSLSRKGHTNSSASSFGDMDILTYSYESTSNKLKKVSDSGNANFGFVDGVNLTTEYAYDDNGNMIEDKNKQIASISYNHLNLPNFIVSSDPNGGHIYYIYDATGVKLEKRVEYYNNDMATTYYSGNFIYEKEGLEEVLKFFDQPEGYVEPNGENFDYVYQYKDHLGGIRLSYSDSDGNGSIDVNTEIISENNYYPFGLEHKGYNNIVSSNSNSAASKYRYNGKEIQEELGLDMYDYGARNYDPALGRWFGIDALAEDYQSSTPYGFVGNNPITNLEIDGRFWIRTVGEDGSVTYTAENGDSAWSLHQQFGEQDGISAKLADQMVQDIFGANIVRGGTEYSNINPEDEITIYNEQESTETTNTEESVAETQESTELEKLDSTLNTMNPVLKAGYKLCCYNDAKRAAVYLDNHNADSQKAMQQAVVDGIASTYINSATPGLEGGSGIGGGSSRSTRTRSTRTGSTRTRGSGNTSGGARSTVTVSGRTLNVQTGSQGGKYYINSNGNRVSLNRDGTKRN